MDVTQDAVNSSIGLKTFTFQDSDVHISFEDQQKINKFARLNAKVDDFKDELKIKQNDVKNLEDASEELSLADDSEKIPYLVGEVFICQNLEDTLVNIKLRCCFVSNLKPTYGLNSYQIHKPEYQPGHMCLVYFSYICIVNERWDIQTQ